NCAGQRLASQLSYGLNLCGLHVLLAALLLERVLLLGPGPGGVDVAQVGVEPVAPRPAGTPGDDLHLLPGLQYVVERHYPAVDLGATAVVADLGMHPVGEVQRGRSP